MLDPLNETLRFDDYASPLHRYRIYATLQRAAATPGPRPPSQWGTMVDSFDAVIGFAEATVGDVRNGWLHTEVQVYSDVGQLVRMVEDGFVRAWFTGEHFHLLPLEEQEALVPL